MGAMSPHEPFTLTPPVGASDHLFGAPHAPVTVVEYGDFECPNCKQAVAAVKMLLTHFENRVRFAYRHFPLENVHPHAELAAEAAECAGGQGRFWEMHDLLFEHQSHLKTEHLLGYAERLQLDMARFNAELSRSRVSPARARAPSEWTGKRRALDPGFLRQWPDPGRLVRPAQPVQRRRSGPETLTFQRGRSLLKGTVTFKGDRPL